MVETNLPVVFLQNVILFPFNDIRIEFSKNKDKLILEESLKNNDGHILLINLKDPKEENPRIKDLPSIGVLGKIKSKIELANGAVRVVITGIDRVSIINYIETEYEYLESFVIPFKEEEYNEIEAKALRRILLKNLNNYIENSSYMSNSVLGRINDVDNIDKLTDIIAFELPLEYSSKLKYLEETNTIKRIKLIANDLYTEIETVKLENELEITLKEKIDESQREYLLKEKLRLIREELGETDLKNIEIDKLKQDIINKDLPDKIRERLNKELKRYMLSSETSAEVTVIRSYIDWLLDLPWYEKTINTYNTEEINNSLNETHYGLEKIKLRICEFVSVTEKIKSTKTPIICLVGPPGVGKTTLAKSIAKSLNKKFVKISVGGINDEAEIVGHRRTYLGATPGKIIQGMKKAGVNNPVFLIDEIDKMTRDYHGDPASALLDILDKEQNMNFVDNYIEEEFDLSNVMFILTANDITRIPPALKDRLEIVELSSYTNYDKHEICKKYIIPKLFKEYKLRDNNINITNDAIDTIIRNYTKESGARELSRQVETICRKIIYNDEKDITIDKDNLQNYLGNKKYRYNKNDDINKSGITNALAYTIHGGEILKVSCCKYKGTGKIKITGNIGNVMNESVDIALSYIKSNSEVFEIDYKIFDNYDFHIHIEDGASPKDGPSAGSVIVTSILSLIKDKQISNKISMTGEITLRGKILPIGGLKEKLIAASINNIEKVFIPYDNKLDVKEISEEITNKLEIIYIKDYLEIYYYLFNEQYSLKK